jgi:branched-chain amino acid transport system ATP-binding protein
MALEVEGVSIAYGQVETVHALSLSVGEGELVALLGANGAGKSSLLRGLSGMIPLKSGEVRMHGRKVDGRSPDAIARSGLVQVPEGRRVIAPLTVLENLEVAARASRRIPRRGIGAALAEVFETFPRLQERQQQASGLMSGGEQQMLAIGRAMMMRPDVLLLDEPSMGLAPIAVTEIYELLKNRSGSLAQVSIVLAEQSAELALGVASRAYVLARGELAFEGPVSELKDEQMISAYLGSAPAS